MASKDYSKMSLEKLKKEYEEQLKQQIVQQIENVSRHVQEHFQSVVREVVGTELGIYRNNYGRWMVQGNESPYIDLIRKSAVQYVQENAESLAKTYLVKIHKDDVSELKEQYKERVMDALYDMMTEKAQEESEKIAEKLFPTKKEEVSDDS